MEQNQFEHRCEYGVGGHERCGLPAVLIARWDEQGAEVAFSCGRHPRSPYVRYQRIEDYEHELTYA